MYVCINKYSVAIYVPLVLKLTTISVPCSVHNSDRQSCLMFLFPELYTCTRLFDIGSYVLSYIRSYVYNSANLFLLYVSIRTWYVAILSGISSSLAGSVR